MEDPAHNLDTVADVVNKEDWILERHGDSTISILVPIDGSSAGSAPKKAQKLVEDSFRHIPGVRIDMAVVRPYRYALKNSFDVKDKSTGNGWRRRLHERFSRSYGVIYLTPVGAGDCQRSRDRQLQRQSIESADLGELSSAELTFKSRNRYLTEAEAEKLSDRSGNKALATLLGLQLVICILAGSGARGFLNQFDLTWPHILIPLMIVGLITSFGIALYRRSTNEFSLAERLFFQLYPVVSGVLLAVLFWQINVENGYIVPIALVSSLAAIVASSGILFTLNYSRMKAIFLQGSAFLGFIFGGFSVYADFRWTLFLSTLGIPQNLVQVPITFSFDVTFFRALVIFVFGSALLGLVGWFIFRFGAGEPSWSSTISIAIVFVFLLSVGLSLDAVYSSSEDAEQLKSDFNSSSATVGYHGVEFKRICAEEVVEDPVVQFGDLDQGSAYWLIPTADSNFWLYQVTDSHTPPDGLEKSLVSELIRVSDEDVKVTLADSSSGCLSEPKESDHGRALGNAER